MTDKKALNIQIGRRVRLARETAGLTQEELAERINVSIQFISDLERGVVGASLITYRNLCKAMHASSDYILLGRKEGHTKERLQSHLDRIRFLPEQQFDLLEENITLFLKALSCRTGEDANSLASPDEI